MRHVFPKRLSQGPARNSRGVGRVAVAPALASLALALVCVAGVRADDDPVPTPVPGPDAKPATADAAGPAAGDAGGAKPESADAEKPGPPGVGDVFPSRLPIVPLPATGANEAAAGVTETAKSGSPGAAKDGGNTGSPPVKSGAGEKPTDGGGGDGADPAGEAAAVVESQAPTGQALAALVGETARPLVLVFWSSECVVCSRYAEALAELAETVGDSAAVVIVATGSEEAPDALRKAFAEVGLGAPVFLDPDRAAAERLGVRVTPTAFVVGPDNVLRYRGPIDDDRRARRRDARALLLPAVQAVASGREVEPADVPPFGSAVR